MTRLRLAARAAQSALAGHPGQPVVRENMAKQGNVVRPTAPGEAAKYFRSEVARCARLVKKAGGKLD